MNVCSKSFFFSKEQILLISAKIYLFTLKIRQPFNIFSPPNISEKLLISCFQDIFSLFSRKSEIKITSTNINSFHYLSKVFENSNIYII
jgi:hypothetical protein